MSVLANIAAAAAPWANFYNDNLLAQTVVSFGHFGGMMVAGGSAVAADRGSLGITRRDQAARLRHLAELSGTHRIVLTALVVTALSGALMLAADIDNLVGSPWFWLKMSLLVLLLTNGWAMSRVERQLRAADPPEQLWTRLERTALTSLVLWLAVVLAGTLLTNLA
jgi:hypothetical protein